MSYINGGHNFDIIAAIRLNFIATIRSYIFATIRFDIIATRLHTQSRIRFAAPKVPTCSHERRISEQDV